MNKSITSIRHDKFMDELPSYADMHEILNRILPKVSGSEKYKIQNVLSVLEQSAKLITTSGSEQDEAIEQLNEILR